METTHTTSHTQQQSKKETASNSNYSRRDIAGTPFTIICRGQDDYILTMGKYLIAVAETEGELTKKIIDKDWQLIGAIASIVAENVAKETISK